MLSDENEAAIDEKRTVRKAKKRNHRCHTFQRVEEIRNVELRMYSTYLDPAKSALGYGFVREPVRSDI